MKHFPLVLMAAVTMCSQSIAQNRVTNVYASSKKLNVELLQNQNQNVQFNRYLFAGYNTLCLPMSMTAEQLQAADVQIERFAAIAQEGSTLYLYFVKCTNEGLQAGVPYLAYSSKSQMLRARNTEVMAVSNDLTTIKLSDDQGNMVSFGSSWEAMTKVGRYGIPAQQETTPLQSILVRTNADKEFLPTRCGFTWEQQSPSATELKIKHVESMSEVSAIQGRLAAKELVDVYDLKGNVIMKQVPAANAASMLTRGIYVINGEKVTVK
ncbi:MAG: hypothetical protein J6M25_03955 [Prevotella sp.]|nr:hypothetical protein [Prevotella sp.]